MSNLVELKGNDVFTTSLVIAEGTGVAHRKLKVTIRKYESEIKSFGLLASYGAESTGGRPEEIYRLNEEQATFLITLLKNTDAVVAFKVELVRQFYSMRRLLLERQISGSLIKKSKAFRWANNMAFFGRLSRQRKGG